MLRNMLRKKLFYMFLMACFCNNNLVFSQSIPNGSFENWYVKTYYYEPSGFGTANMQSFFTIGSGNANPSNDAHSGNYSATLQTVGSGSNVIPGVLLIGQPMPGGISGGIPYTDSPDSLSFYAKFNIQPYDTATLFVVLKKMGNTVAYAIARLYGTQNTWVEYKIPFHWQTIMMPDTLALVISSSDVFNNNLIPGSNLMIDDIQFTNVNGQLPNGDFESWSPVQFEEPYDWETPNFVGIYTGVYSVKKSTDSYDGQYAISVENILMPYGDTIGYITNGKINGIGEPEGGCAVNQNIEKVRFYYKYFPKGLDTAVVAVISFRYDPILQKSVKLDSTIIKLPPTNTYAFIEIPMNYNSWSYIDTVNITFLAGNIDINMNSIANSGSVLIVDKVEMTYLPLAVSEVENSINCNVVPNPASDIITINTSIKENGNFLIRIYDFSGKFILEEKNYLSEDNKINIDVSKLPKGLYFYKIENERYNKSGKFIKQ